MAYEFWIYHGILKTLSVAQIYAPRRVSMYFGNQSAMSFENETLFAEILVPIAARAQHAAAKNCAARLSHSTATSSGFHVCFP
jgi:hypothetical protein